MPPETDFALGSLVFDEKSLSCLLASSSSPTDKSHPSPPSRKYTKPGIMENKPHPSSSPVKSGAFYDSDDNGSHSDSGYHSSADMDGGNGSRGHGANSYNRDGPDCGSTAKLPPTQSNTIKLLPTSIKVTKTMSELFLDYSKMSNPTRKNWKCNKLNSTSNWTRCRRN